MTPSTRRSFLGLLAAAPVAAPAAVMGAVGMVEASRHTVHLVTASDFIPAMQDSLGRMAEEAGVGVWHRLPELIKVPPAAEGDERIRIDFVTGEGPVRERFTNGEWVHFEALTTASTDVLDHDVATYCAAA